jgi:hypothetical protein
MAFLLPDLARSPIDLLDRAPGERTRYEGEIATSEKLQMAKAVRQLAGREMPPCKDTRETQS